MRTVRLIQHKRRRWFSSVSIPLLVLAFALAACGFNSGSTQTGANPTPTPTTKAESGSKPITGCPSSDVITTTPPQANVIITSKDSMVTAHTGDVIEVRLPFGQKWSGPQNSVSGVEMQHPSGYAWQSDKVCVWRFIARSSGTTKLMFSSSPLCKSGQMCPMHIVVVPFTIEVK